MAASAAWFYILVFAICTVSICLADEGLFVSIDCGSTDDYTDDNQIYWSGDGSYIDGGETKTVPSDSSISHVMDTLRVFTTTRKKNCYYIKSVRLGRVLVRASFHYGNYDGKSSPPTFDLILDGNHWASVNTSTNSGFYKFAEAIYVVTTGSISVCVAQTAHGQFPFMSALEVRGLGSNMYNQVDNAYPLFRSRSFAYGADKTIRYPDDPYDRLWNPWSPATGSGLTTLSGNVSVNGSSVYEEPPPLIFQTAISASNASSNIILDLPLYDVDIQIYITLYFAEVAEEPNKVRSFRVFKDGSPFSDSIQPIYANIIELYGSNLTYSPNSLFSLVPDNNATLPPLINALEIFEIGPTLTDGTDKSDVSNLALLQNTFDALKGWKGDPCLPAPYSWDWIKCSNDSTPRVTALLLGNYSLLKMIPDLSSMDALERIELQNNNINGPIPDFLAELPNLKELNLANNNFSGTIPASLSKNGLNIIVRGNPYLCPTGESCQGAPKSSDTPNSTSPGTLPTNSSAGNMKKKTRATMFGFTVSSFFMVVFIGVLMGI